MDQKYTFERLLFINKLRLEYNSSDVLFFSQKIKNMSIGNSNFDDNYLELQGFSIYYLLFFFKLNFKLCFFGLIQIALKLMEQIGNEINS